MEIELFAEDRKSKDPGREKKNLARSVLIEFGILANGDNPNGSRFIGGFPEIELTPLLEVRPAVLRARRSLHGKRKAIALCGGLSLRALVVVRCRRDGYGEGDDARNKGGGGNPDDLFEHFVPVADILDA